MKKKILKNIKNIGNSCYEKLYIGYRTNNFRNYYTKSHIANNVEDTLTKAEKILIDEYFLRNYGKKIPYCYHNLYKFYNGKFDIKYFPDELIAPKLQRYINNPSFAKVISNKNFLPIIAEKAGVKMPETVIFNKNGVFYNKDYKIISKEEAKGILLHKKDVFVKPTKDTSGGSKCKVYDKDTGYEELKGEDIDSIFDLYKKDFTVQSLVKNHESIRNIYPKSLNTIRLTTYIIDGKVYNVKGLLRLGANDSRIDNASTGGIYVCVGDDGKLNDFASNESGVGKLRHFEHPDTKVAFKDYSIENYPKVIEAAKRMHSLIPELGIIDWDIAIDEFGDPVVVEANCINGGGIQMVQCNDGKGAFGENTEYILKFLRDIEKMDRKENLVGNLHM